MTGRQRGRTTYIGGISAQTISHEDANMEVSLQDCVVL
jgi:hypothetical protein